MLSHPWLLALSLVVALLQARCLAIDYYVDNALGNNRLPGTSPRPVQGDGPVATISRALQLATRSDRIVIANTGAVYHEMLSLTGPHHSGTAERPFVIVGNGAIVDGTVVAAPGAWRHVVGSTFAMQPRRLAYQRLFLEGKPLPPAQVTSADALQPLEWMLAGGRIYFETSDNRAPESYDLRHCGLQTGLTLYNTRHLRIENLILQGFQQDGINAHELVDHCHLVDVECRANGRSGLSAGGVSRVRVTGSNFYDNGRVQVRTEGLAELDLAQCDVAKEPVPPFSADGRLLRVDGERLMTR